MVFTKQHKCQVEDPLQYRLNGMCQKLSTQFKLKAADVNDYYYFNPVTKSFEWMVHSQYGITYCHIYQQNLFDSFSMS